MIVRYKSPAYTELADACDWYEAESPGRGNRFLAAVERTVERITCFPKSSPVDEDGVRRAILSRYPYVLHYLIENDEIIVYAVAHTSRAPDYWVERLE